MLWHGVTCTVRGELWCSRAQVRQAYRVRQEQQICQEELVCQVYRV